ncbi:hypothetical protein KFK09_025291 [Dendrobium nobile]|uniref:Uncharacterized protein n=1 Tax=Dendrobium nobile TaxID=94219 RepID=A0A8T3AHB9_DENNO|nr:hypothetical protein KFK09_025291 [Dendrobium nobile]
MEQSEAHTDSNADMNGNEGCAIHCSSDLLDRDSLPDETTAATTAQAQTRRPAATPTSPTAADQASADQTPTHPASDSLTRRLRELDLSRPDSSFAACSDSVEGDRFAGHPLPHRRRSIVQMHDFNPASVFSWDQISVHNRSTSSKENNRNEEQKQQPRGERAEPMTEKTVESLPLPMQIPGWYGGLPLFGYMTQVPLQHFGPVDASASSSKAIQILFPSQLRSNSDFVSFTTVRAQGSLPGKSPGSVQEKEGVQMLDVKATYKADPMPCSQAARCNVADNFRQLDSHPAHKKQLDPNKYHEIENSLIFVGVADLRDPPRAEVYKVIEYCRGTGIKVIIIIGDNDSTAELICHEIGLARNLEGVKWRSFTDKIFFTGLLINQKLELLSKPIDLIFPCAEPRHKLEIVRLLQETGEVVAMTGDVANDEPTLKLANIGISMGITESEIAKEAGKAMRFWKKSLNESIGIGLVGQLEFLIKFMTVKANEDIGKKSSTAFKVFDPGGLITNTPRRSRALFNARGE